MLLHGALIQSRFVEKMGKRQNLLQNNVTLFIFFWNKMFLATKCYNKLLLYFTFFRGDEEGLLLHHMTCLLVVSSCW